MTNDLSLGSKRLPTSDQISHPPLLSKNQHLTEDIPEKEDEEVDSFSEQHLCSNTKIVFPRTSKNVVVVNDLYINQ